MFQATAAMAMAEDNMDPVSLKCADLPVQKPGFFWVFFLCFTHKLDKIGFRVKLYNDLYDQN